MQIKKVTVYLALGSNLEDRPANLLLARSELAKVISIVKTSSVYETPPWGYTSQPSFLNQVIAAKTRFAPSELLSIVKGIEKKMGRMETFRNGPRLIDIDILLYGSQLINTAELILPHPRLLERGFVLVPLAEIAPRLVIPGTDVSVKDQLKKIDQKGILKVESITQSTDRKLMP